MLRDLRRRVGACFVAGFEGTEPSAELLIYLRDYSLAGVILFARNLKGADQAAALVSGLQGQTRELPLLVAVDQEGGTVSRLPCPPFTRFPTMRALGMAGSVDLARRLGGALAAELRAVGINWDLAPVLDVNVRPDNPVIGSRSLSGDSGLVARLGGPIVEGLQSGGVVATGKHFPGHGATAEDSHLALPVVRKEEGELRGVDLPPFRAAIEAGVATMMTAHVLYPALDPERPATLSSAIVRGLLRGEMGYGGVVVSDDLEMKALDPFGGAADRAVAAIEAGVDLLLVCRSRDFLAEAWEGVLGAVESGRIPRERLEESWTRTTQLRRRFLVPHARVDIELARASIGRADHERLAAEIERAGMP